MGQSVTKSGTVKAQDGNSAADATREKIIHASYKCFERFGISKTTIEDIAEMAGVSRPTVYKYFSGKQDIVGAISTIESLKVNAEIRRVVQRGSGFPETLSECVFLGVRMMTKSTWNRVFAESHEVTTQSATPGSPVHRVMRERWEPLIRHGIEAGEVAPDLDIDEIVSWLFLTHHMILTMIETSEMSDAKLRAFVRRFIVEPLVPPRGPAPAAKKKK